MMSERLRGIVVRGLAVVEDVVYVGLGVVLSVSAVALLFSALKSFVTAVSERALPTQIVGLLDQILLILLIIELLYTVQVSFREHGLVVEPFVVIALIAVIRRILVLTAELPKLPQAGGAVLSNALLELSLLTVMVVVLVAALIALQRQTKQRTHEEK